MKNFIKDNLFNVFNLHRYVKRIIAMLTDAGFCIFCTWLAFVLRIEELILLRDFNFYLAIISIIIALPIFWLFGLYRAIFRYTSLSIVTNILMSSFLYGFLYFLVVGVYGVPSYTSNFEIVPRSIGIIQPMLVFFAVIFTRLFAKYLFYKNFGQNSLDKKNILVYGAGDAGRQLVTSLENNPEFKVKGFLDDKVDLHYRVLLGQTIYPPFILEKIVSK